MINRYPRIGIDVNDNVLALKVPGQSREVGKGLSIVNQGNPALQTMTQRGYVNKMDLFRKAVETGRPDGKIYGRSNAFEVWNLEKRPRSRSRYDATTLRAIYKQAAAVRTAVDTIIREVTTLPWAVVPKESDPKKVKSVTWRRCLEAVDFFENPNQNPETFQQLLSKFLTDMLVLDAGAIELVKSVMGNKLVELFVRDGSTIMPKADINGVITHYVQHIVRVGKTIDVIFEPDELLYVMLFPQSDSLYGLPILDSIINEVAALLYAMDYIANSFSESEISPGILHLGNIGDEAYHRAKNEFKLTQQRGIKNTETKIRVIDNVDLVEWIELKRPNREQQVVQLIRLIEKVVFRSFGVQPTEVGLVEGITKATAEVLERIGQIKLIKPLMTILSTNINRVIIPSLGYKDIMFKFILRRVQDNRGEALAEKDRVFTGLRTINEQRETDGFLPVEGGDRPFVLVGKRIYFVDELEKAISEAWSQEGDDAMRGGHQDESEPPEGTPTQEED